MARAAKSQYTKGANYYWASEAGQEALVNEFYWAYVDRIEERNALLRERGLLRHEPDTPFSQRPISRVRPRGSQA